MQKNKLLLLTEILKQESDADHPITTYDLIERLSNIGISCDRRTLAIGISLHLIPADEKDITFIND